MFKLRFLVAAPAALALASMACSAEVGQSPEPTESLQAASTSCPSGSKDAQQRAAASAAYSIMKAASSKITKYTGLPRTDRNELVATVTSTPLFSSKPSRVSR